jgi:hypothetical protein
MPHTAASANDSVDLSHGDHAAVDTPDHSV